LLSRKNSRLVLSALMGVFTLVVVLAFFTLETIYSARDEFTDSDLIYISWAFLAISVAITISISTSILLPTKLGIAANALTGVIFAAAVFSINWAMVEAVILLPTIAIFSICAMAAYLAYIVLNLNYKVQAGISIATIAVFIFMQGQSLLDKPKSNFIGIEDIEFDTKPNVYLISFDSIQPKSLTSRYMGINETPFHEPMYSRLDLFENLFSARVPTKYAMNVMLQMDVNEFDSLGKVKFDFYTGKREGRLSAIFKSNGYEINTLYSSKYFGIEKGPFVNRYQITSNSESGACKFNDSKFRTISLFGLCAFNDSNKKVVKETNTAATALLDFVSFLSRQQKPQFMLAYVYSPGHTSKDFLIENEEAVIDYNKFYLESSLKTRNTISEILDQLERKDPTAIVYLFGDHGPWRSRGEWNARFKQDPDFFVHDRFGILGGLFPKGRCETYVKRRNEQPYTTSIQGAEAILKCLTGGRYQELAQEYEINRIKNNVNDISVKFEDYTYE